MNVLFLSPGYPTEMNYFARALARTGATVFGLGDQPHGALPEAVREHVAFHLQVPDLWDEPAVEAAVRALAARHRLDRVECLWEPGMLLAARLREALGLPGMTVAETLPFRDKELMKQALEAAGVRTPRHARAASAAEVRAAAERLGFPLIVKPIAGAGSADTYRVASAEELDEVLPKIRHVAEVSVEEYVDGEEYTFDTICAGGEILFASSSWYRPKPLVGRSEEWISPQTVTLRDLSSPGLVAGRELGLRVLAALGFRTGFTHMEWFLTPRGEAVFGEIGARPPGARSVDTMNYCCDNDVYAGWAEAVVHGRLHRTFERRFNSAVIFKRARGHGRIRQAEGWERLRSELGAAIVGHDLLPVGAHRRDWKQTLLSDGWVFVRHPDLATLCAIADRIGSELHLFAE